MQELRANSVQVLGFIAMRRSFIRKFKVYEIYNGMLISGCLHFPQINELST